MTWHSPNPAGANGLQAIGEKEAADKIAYGMPDVLGNDRARYAGKTVAVLGAGHSAIGTLTDLARLAEQAPEPKPIWLLRGNDPAKAFGGGANDKLAARGIHRSVGQQESHVQLAELEIRDRNLTLNRLDGDGQSLAIEIADGDG